MMNETKEKIYWKDLKTYIEKADMIINKHKEHQTEFYSRQRNYWKGFKAGIGLTYKILNEK